MNINAENLAEKLISKALGIKGYTEIITTLHSRNLSTDKDYQRLYNSFFVVRRNEAWRTIYYDFFEKNKGRQDITFEEILYYLFEKTGQIEHSFSSKMLATIKPNMPIWDVYILNHVGFELQGKTKQEQLKNRVQIYNQIIAWYDEFLLTSEATACIEKFDQLMPSYRWITPIKKIDYIIWGIRE
ncbi:MAG: hypothetical protein R3Y06_08155 [Faecalibacterium sp.]